MTDSRALVAGTLAAILKHEDADSLDGLAADLDALIAGTEPVGIVKIDPERRMVYGWITVATVKGEPVVDRQGDVMSVDDMREMAHDFIGKRALGVMHEPDPWTGEARSDCELGEFRESVIFDADLQKALGIDLGREGWFGGVYVRNDETWDRVVKGELRAFSIEGLGEREPITKALTFNDVLRTLPRPMIQSAA